MALLLAFVLGAALGWLIAVRRRRVLLDRLHHAAVFGLAFFVAMLAVMVIIAWQWG